MNELSEAIKSVQDVISKAAVTNATYSFSPPSRSIFTPENLDPVVKLVVPTAVPLRAALPRTQGMGQAAVWKKLTSQLAPRRTNTGGATGMDVSGFFADGGTPNDTSANLTFTTVSAAYKIIGRDVTIGRFQISSSRGYEDIRDELVRIKTLECMLAEEDGIINGDSAQDTNAFDGLIKLITTNSGSLSLLTASGIGSQIQTVFWNYGGTPDLVACNPRQVRALADDLQGSGSIQRIVVDDQGSGIGGVRLAKVVNPIDGTLMDVIPSRYMGNWALILDVRSPAGENWIEMEDLDPLSVYDVPTSVHAVQERVFESTVLKLIAEPFQVKIGGMATS